jgi:hypothetical protein
MDLSPRPTIAIAASFHRRLSAIEYLGSLYHFTMFRTALVTAGRRLSAVTAAQVRIAKLIS